MMKFTKVKGFLVSLGKKIAEFFTLLLKKIKGLKIKESFKKTNKAKIWKITRLTILILIGVYILTGIGFGIAVYKYNSESRAVKIAVKVFPYPIEWVNGRAILASSFYQQLGYVKQYSQQSQQPVTDEKQLKTQLLSQLTDQKIVQEQAKKLGVKVSRDDVNQAFYKIADQNGGSDAVVKVLQEMYGMNINQFKDMVKQQLYTDKIQSNLLVQVHAEHILIKDEAKAKDVLEQVKKGDKSFEDLAKENSEDTGSKDNSGDLGWFYRGQMVKEFEEAAFSLQSGSITGDLVKSDYGYHIIKVLERKGSIDKSLSDWLAEVKQNAKIHQWINLK